MKFSILSWNVEHFRGGTARVKKVADHIKADDPDVFGLLEVENLEVLTLMQAHFPGYDFGISDGPENMEILVGWRRHKFQQAVFTQKREFKLFNPDLRPGALLSVRLQGQVFNVLYLHTDSGTDAPAFGNRVEMFAKVWKLKEAIDGHSGQNQGRLVVLGDLNTMGLQFPTKSAASQLVTSSKEVLALATLAGKKGLAAPLKSHDLTFNNGKLQSDLDHALVSHHLKLAVLGKRPDNRDFFVRVRGWQQLTGAARVNFIENISDHCSLFLEVRL
jgi:hypothetical protein